MSALPDGVESLPDRGELPLLRLHGPQGARMDVCPQGAQVLSWRDASGRESLYLSPQARFERGASIRGGVPVVFPQFSGRGALAKHGFLRGLPWRFDGASVDSERARMAFTREDCELTRAAWPHAFQARVEIVLGARSLEVALHVRNTGTAAFAFTAALHSYLAADDVAAVSVQGLEGRPYEDAAGGGLWRVQNDDTLAFDGELDRVYPEVRGELVMREADRRLQVGVAGFPDVVVWNPGPVLAAELADLGEGQHRRFACIEAACVLKPIVLAPGMVWQGHQRLVTGG